MSKHHSCEKFLPIKPLDSYLINISDTLVLQGPRRKREIRKAKLSSQAKFMHTSDTGVSLYSRIEQPNGYEPVVKSAATIVPKPSNIEYESTVRTMNSCANGKYDVPELGIILSADSDNFLSVNGIVSRKIWGPRG